MCLTCVVNMCVCVCVLGGGGVGGDICLKDAHVVKLLIHTRMTHVVKKPVEAAQTGCKNTHTYIGCNM